MSVQVNPIDLPHLQVGATCIIVVDSVNSPTGTWWGKVTSVHGARIDVAIWGGRFQFTAITWEYPFVPVLSDEHRGDIPTVHCHAYRDDETTRKLFGQLHAADKAAAVWQERAQHWKEVHHTTMAHIAASGSLRAPHRPEAAPKPKGNGDGNI